MDNRLKFTIKTISLRKDCRQTTKLCCGLFKLQFLRNEKLEFINYKNDGITVPAYLVSLIIGAICYVNTIISLIDSVVLPKTFIFKIIPQYYQEFIMAVSNLVIPNEK